MKKLLMGVYNPIQYDARVIRSAKALYKKFLLEVFTLNYDKNSFPVDFKVSYIKSVTNKLGYLKFMFFFVIKIIKEKPRIIYTHDYYLPVAGVMSKLLYNSYFIYDAHEFVVPTKSEKKSLRKVFFYLLEKFSVKYADLIIVPSRERKLLMKSVYGNKKYLIVKNIPSSINIKESPYKEISETDKKNVILYQGYISRARGISIFIKVMKHLPNYKFIIAGDGPDLISLKEEAGDLLNKCIFFVGRLNQKELFDLTIQAEFGIIYYPKTTLNNRYCAPNKIYEYAQAKLKIISSDQVFFKNLFSKHEIGKAINLDRIASQDLAKIIIDMSIQSFSDNEYKHFLEENNWFMEETKLINTILKVV